METFFEIIGLAFCVFWAIAISIVLGLRSVEAIRRARARPAEEAARLARRRVALDARRTSVVRPGTQPARVRTARIEGRSLLRPESTVGRRES